ncbi:hypothetical protein [Pseudomonas sp. 25 E 4]|nr:hypothetical protein [Pseudomonas sp. 25 E 4]
MNIRDLICREKFDTRPCAFKALGQVFASFFLFVGLQLDNVEELLFAADLLQIGDQRRFTKQEHVRTAFRRTGGQRQQRFQGGLVELLGVVHQQVDFLTGQAQLHHLLEDGIGLGVGHVQCLGDLTQHARRIAGTTGRHHHALHRLLVGAGDQRLAQQGLAAAQRARHHQQQLAVARKVMQLTQHRLALGREEFETRHPWSKGVVAQLVVAEERLVGVQTSHRDLINL